MRAHRSLAFDEGVNMVQMIEDPAEKARIAERILGALPDWFGIPESTRKYIEDSKNLPFWAHGEDGFIAMQPTSQHTAEIYVMGVLPDRHRRGVGRALVAALEAYAAENGYEFLQVKTVQKGHYAEYDQTCAFYEGVGFRELECFPTLWDEKNPCQIYIKAI